MVVWWWLLVVGSSVMAVDCVMVVCSGIWLDLLGFALSCVFGCGGCGGCVVVAVGCWQ